MKNVYCSISFGMALMASWEFLTNEFASKM